MFTAGGPRRRPGDQALGPRRAGDHRRDPASGRQRDARRPAHRPGVVEGHRPPGGHAGRQPARPGHDRHPRRRRAGRLPGGRPRDRGGRRPAGALLGPRPGHHRRRRAARRRLRRPLHGDRRGLRDLGRRGGALDPARRLRGPQPRRAHGVLAAGPQRQDRPRRAPAPRLPVHGRATTPRSGSCSDGARSARGWVAARQGCAPQAAYSSRSASWASRSATSASSAATRASSAPLSWPSTRGRRFVVAAGRLLVGARRLRVVASSRNGLVEASGGDRPAGARLARVAAEQLAEAVLLLAGAPPHPLDVALVAELAQHALHVVQRREMGHPVAARLQLARRLGAAQQQHAQERQLVAIQAQPLLGEVAVLGGPRSGAAGQAGQPVLREPLGGVADLALVVVR